MVTKEPEFLSEATNVYRTRNYIVRQVIGISFDDKEDNAIISRDTYYLRTKVRNAAYELAFCSRKNINGKRFPTMMYSREYID